MSIRNLELEEAIERAEKAERREERFRTWWTGVSKQLDDLKRQYAAETWESAESCETHGRTIKDLDAELTKVKQLGRETESARVKLVVGLHVLQDIVRGYRKGHARNDLTVDRLMNAVGRIVDRTLDDKRPPRVEQLDLFGTMPEPTEDGQRLAAGEREDDR